MFYKVGTWLCRLGTQTFWSHQFSFELLPDFLCELKIKQFVIASLFIETIHKNDRKIAFFILYHNFDEVLKLQFWRCVIRRSDTLLFYMLKQKLKLKNETNEKTELVVPWLDGKLFAFKTVLFKNQSIF
jgi:hypothetical protein